MTFLSPRLLLRVNNAGINGGRRRFTEISPETVEAVIRRLGIRQRFVVDSMGYIMTWALSFGTPKKGEKRKGPLAISGKSEGW